MPSSPAGLSGLAQPPSLAETLAAVFEANSERPALRSAQGICTYGELEQRSLELARRLRGQHGLGPGSTAIVRLERGRLCIEMLLALIRLGAAYLPLPPSLDSGAADSLLAQCPADWIVLDAALCARLLQAPAEAAGGAGHPLPWASVSEEAVLYVMPTSGSSGPSRLAMVPRRAIGHLAAAVQQRFGCLQEAWAHLHAPSFGYSTFEILMPLLGGGSLWIPDAGGLPQAALPARVADQLRGAALDNLCLTPSGLFVFLESLGSRPDFGGLKRIFLSGERLSQGLVNRWFNLPEAQRPSLINTYATTEAGGQVFWRQLSSADQQDADWLGDPLPHARLLVLDPDRQPLPQGQEGELAVAGPGLFLGYHGTTSDNRITRSLDGVDQPLLLTGDRVLRDDRGRYRYRGRLSGRLKLRGRFFDPTEVAAVLERHPHVASAEVLVAAAGDRDRLVAFVTLRAGGRDMASPQGGMGISQQLLADYADHRGDLPSLDRVLPLEAMPMTASNKADRRLLAERAETWLAAEEAASASPIGPTCDDRLSDPLAQAVLVAVRQQLGGSTPAEGDHFFRLGGSSLDAAALAAALTLQLGFTVHVVDVYDHPVLSDLIDHLARQTRPPSAAGVIRSGLDPVDFRLFSDLAAAADQGESPMPSRPSRLQAPVFILSPPRSGSTLLRVLLAGHTGVIAPPELELLRFGSPLRWWQAFSGRNQVWREGMVEFLMRLEQLSEAQALTRLEGLVHACDETHELYDLFASHTAGQIFVDKSTYYALSARTLSRIQLTFPDCRIVHLVRDPLACINSYADLRLDLFLPFTLSGYDASEIAELLWDHAHRAILRLAESLPAGRYLRLHYEDLVAEPAEMSRRLCAFLEIPFEAQMLAVHEDRQARMTKGSNANTLMLGDPRFFARGFQGIEAGSNRRWLEDGRRYVPGRRVCELHQALRRGGGP